VTAKRAGFWRRHRALKWALVVLLLALVALGVGVSVALHHAEPILRAAIVHRLEEHFHARVELDSFHVSLVDGLRAEGKGLRIWPSTHAEGTNALGADACEDTGFFRAQQVLYATARKLCARPQGSKTRIGYDSLPESRGP